MKRNGHRGIFIGIQPNSNAYLVDLPNRDKIIASGGVRFDELREYALKIQQQITEAEAPAVEAVTSLNDEEWMERALTNIADFLMRKSV